MTMTFVFAIVALILAVIDLIRSKAQSQLAWAVVLLALALTWPVFR